MGMINKPKTLNKVLAIPIDSIYPNPDQPRKTFDREKLEQLSQSIRANGLLQPITVLQMQNGTYRLVAGERRLIACRQIGYVHIPAIIQEISQDTSAVLALVENLQREDLNFFEEAAAIEALIKQSGENQQYVAKKLGKAQSTIANKLRLLKFPPEIQKLLLKLGLTERHARALLPIDDMGQVASIAQYVAENGLNVAQTEQYMLKLLGSESKRETRRVNKRGFVVKDLRIFMNSINRAVDIMRQSGIQALSEKDEDDQFISYTIRIPKTAVHIRRSTPA